MLPSNRASLPLLQLVSPLREFLNHFYEDFRSLHVFINLILINDFHRICSACGKAMQGQFVRALGTVFHLNCFKCMVRV